MRKDHSVWRKNSSTSRLGYRLVAKSVHERMYSARKLNTNEWHTDTLHTHTQARAHKTHKTHIGIVRLECRLLASSIPAFHSIGKYIVRDVLRRSRPMRCFFFCRMDSNAEKHKNNVCVCLIIVLMQPKNEMLVMCAKTNGKKWKRRKSKWIRRPCTSVHKTKA